MSVAIYEIRVYEGENGDPRADALVRQTAHDGIDIGGVATSRVFYLEGVTDDEAERLAGTLLSDPVTQTAVVGPRGDWDNERHAEVAPLPGATNREVGSILRGAALLGIQPTGAGSGTEYIFPRSTPLDTVARVVGELVNPTVEQKRTAPPSTLRITGERGPVETVPIRSLDDIELLKLSAERKLALNLREMQTIRDKARAMGRELRDAELEYLAGAWSEHCCHKTTNAKVMVDGVEKPSIFSRIKGCSIPYFEERGVLSAFNDNSGVWKFYDGYALNIKLETHNSPLNVEPRGGAATGTGGDLRDIVFSGKGAQVINSMHMGFTAPPDIDPDNIPPGALSPTQLLTGSVSGVGGYGNPMGVPTNNGSSHFDKRYRGKASILVGSMGIMREQDTQQGFAQPGDLVMAVGARTGRDGLHGATFSSESADASTAQVHSGAVQIGDPIAEKKMFDAIAEASERGLIRAMTDCGAAGFASAIGELGEHLGVRVDLAKAPLKYSGLAPWEILQSESQERGVLAVDPQHKAEVLAIFAKYDSEATVLGEFGTPGGEPKLEVLYGDEVVVDLDYEFIKNGREILMLEAMWATPAVEDRRPAMPNLQTALETVLSDWNVCSKEPIVRKYDHEVQGANAMNSYAGVHGDAPNNAAVMAPILGKPYAVVQAHGCNPVLTELDPKWGSVWSYAEGMSNFVAAGGNPDDAIIVNNYISATPTPRVMGALDASVDALAECVHEFRSPIISGKDSLSSTYKYPDGTVLESPYNLVITVAGKIPDVEKTVSTDIKQPGSTLVLIGKPDYESMGGSVYYSNFDGASAQVPRIDLPAFHQTCTALHQAIQTGGVLAAHDVSEGGLAVTVSEMLFGGDCGAELTFADTGRGIENLLFNETAGCFVVEVANEAAAEELFGAVPHQIIGKTTHEKTLQVTHGQTKLSGVDTDNLKAVWKRPLQEVFA